MLTVFWDTIGPITINFFEKKCNYKQFPPIANSLSKIHLIYWMTLIQSWIFYSVIKVFSLFSITLYQISGKLYIYHHKKMMLVVIWCGLQGNFWYHVIIGITDQKVWYRTKQVRFEECVTWRKISYPSSMIACCKIICWFLFSLCIHHIRKLFTIGLHSHW